MELSDFLKIREFLNQEERDTWDMARKFVDDEWLHAGDKKYARSIECWRQSRFPIELVKKFAELGFLGMAIKPEYGGAGIGPVAYGLVNYEIERGDSALRSFISVTNALVCFPILEYGSEDQRTRYLPKLCSGDLIGCFGLTEAGGGSNPEENMLMTAVADGDSYILTGEKQFITNATIADIAVVWAKVDGVSHGFLVERGTPGFRQEVSGEDRKLSLVCSDTGSLVFEQCRIPKEWVLPRAVGKKAYLRCLTEARYGIAWGAVGAAAGCYEAALLYVKERSVFRPKPLAGHQLVQQKLVEMVAGISYAQAACLILGRLKEKKELGHTQVSLAKCQNVAMAQRVARLARGLLGAPGILDRFPPMRHLINLETVATYEGTDDINMLAVGKEITGFDAFH